MTDPGAQRQPPRIWPANSGVVYNLQRRAESVDGLVFQVWSFQLLRLEDGHRRVQPPIPVELRGRAISGQLARGDVVEIPSGREGQTRVVRTVRNLSTQSVIKARGHPLRRTKKAARISWVIFIWVLSAALLVGTVLVLLRQYGLVHW